MSGTSTAYLFNATFTNCVALLGGAIYASNYVSLVLDSCSFYSNIVFMGFAQNVFSVNAKGNLTIINSNFKNYHNNLYALDTKLLSI